MSKTENGWQTKTFPLDSGGKPWTKESCEASRMVVEKGKMHPGGDPVGHGAYAAGAETKIVTIFDYQQATFFALREFLNVLPIGTFIPSHHPCSELWRVFRDDPTQGARRERLVEQTGKRLERHGHGLKVVAT